MDVAIRAVNWLWALSLLAPSSELTEAILADIVASLVAHGRFLTDNLEVREDGVTTNHYLADIVGLLYLGLCLKEVGEAGPWRTLAVGELVREMDRQVCPTASTTNRACRTIGWSRKCSCPPPCSVGATGSCCLLLFTNA